MVILKLIAEVFMGFFVRAGGDDDLLFSSNIDRGILGGGLLYFMYSGFTWSGWQPLLIFMACFMLSEAVGYSKYWSAVINGAPMREGRGWRWWEIKAVRDSKLKAAVLRSLISFAAMLPACYVVNSAWPAAGAFFGFLAAPYITYKILPSLNYYFADSPNKHLVKFFRALNMGEEKGRGWHFGEALRGWINGAFSFLP